MPNRAQESTPSQGESAHLDTLLIVDGDGPADQDHEDEEETRRRLDEWRSMAANLSGGFTQMPDRVRKDPTLSSNAKLVYEHLLGYMWSKDWCWPSQKTIAKELGISRRTVIRVCKELHERFYIEKWRRGLGRTNVYFVNPLSIAFSTGITLTEINLRLPTSIKPDAPLAVLYGTCFYADDPHKLEECQNDTSRSDKTTHPEAPESHTKHTNMKDIQGIDRDSKNSTEAPKGTVFPSPAMTIRSENNNQPNGEDTKTQQPSVSTPSKPNTQPNDRTEAAAETAKEVKTAKSAQAQAIAAATGISPAHLAELGIAQESARRPIPDFITRIIGDFTRDLGDNPRSARSNITRATKLYYFAYDYIAGAQDDPEGFFLDLLYQAKQAAQRVNNIRKRTGNRLNRIPVFFTCLENIFALTDDERAYVRSDLPLLRPEDRDQ